MKSILDLLPGDWVTRAACGQAADPDDWFPLRDGPKAAHIKAKATCNACPVLADCLAYITEAELGFSRRDRHGTWAGLTPRERAAVDPTPKRCTRCGREVPRGGRRHLCPDCGADASASTCATCMRPFSGKGPAGRPIVDCAACRRRRKKPHIQPTGGVR